MGQSEPVAAGRARSSKPAADNIRNVLGMDSSPPFKGGSARAQYFHLNQRFCKYYLMVFSGEDAAPQVQMSLCLSVVNIELLPVCSLYVHCCTQLC